MVDILEFLSLRSQLPVIDVRSEGEYEEGHMRSAINIPLLNNAERVAVGTDYKQKGQLAAIKTGFRLVGPRLAGIIEETGLLLARRNAVVELLSVCWNGGNKDAAASGRV
jgi:tRNA 2-selenouridine synthase